MNPLAFLKTAFSSNLSAISLTEKESAALAAKGIQEPMLQRFAKWRRATLFTVVLATLLSAGVSSFETYTDDDEEHVVGTITAGLLEKIEEVIPEAAPFVKAAAGKVEEMAEARAEDDEEEAAPEDTEEAKAAAKKAKAEAKESEPKTKTMEKVIDVVHLMSLYALPAAAVLALVLGRRLRLSYRVLLAGFALSFLTPILIQLCPWSWWGYVEPELSLASDPAKYLLNEAETLMEGLSAMALLLPAVLSLIPGVVRGCLLVKTLLPQSVLPGWLVVMAAPLYGLFLLVIFVALDQVTGQPLVLAGFFFITASSLVYAFRADTFTRPLRTPDDYRRMKNVRRVVGLCTALGGILLLAYIIPREFMGVHLVGTEQKSSVMRPIEVAVFLLEFISRSMFVGALSADLFLRVNLDAWKQQQALAISPDVEDYNAAMEAVEEAVAGKNAAAGA